MYYISGIKKYYGGHMSEKKREKILRTHYIMNRGIMEWSIRQLKRELKVIDEEITLEQAIDWLRASEMYTEEEIADFIENWQNFYKRY